MDSKQKQKLKYVSLSKSINPLNLISLYIKTDNPGSLIHNICSSPYSSSRLQRVKTFSGPSKTESILLIGFKPKIMEQTATRNPRKVSRKLQEKTKNIQYIFC